jgi:hypothetical protein
MLVRMTRGKRTRIQHQQKIIAGKLAQGKSKKEKTLIDPIRVF